MSKAIDTPGARWLFKEEPNSYSYNDLERDGETVRDGVDNNLARKNLRLVHKGDAVLTDTGTERAIVGEMQVVEGPMPDPASDDPKAVVVKMKPLRRWKKPVSLDRIKKEPALAQWELVRIGRLSVMPVSAEQLEKVLELRDQHE